MRRGGETQHQCDGERERDLGVLKIIIDMVVMFCSFKTNRKFAQKNRTGPCSLFYSFCVRKLEQLFAQFAHNSHNPNKIRTVYKIRTNSHNSHNSHN